MSKIPVFDIGNTLAPTEDEINQSVTKKLHQQGISEVPHFPEDEYNIYNPKDVQEWLDEHEVETDAERISLAYKGQNKRFFQRKGLLKLLRRLGEDFGPIGFVADNTTEAREFYQNLFEGNDEEEPINYEGFVVPSDVDEEGLTVEVFEEFLDQREEDADRFVYFSNDARNREEVEEAGMEFVLVKQYDYYDDDYDGPEIRRMVYGFIKKQLEE
ncbi:MAG: hypothetical protein ABEJ99_02900 [Candidatus Nanohaloarchaea archaeon]